MSGNVLALRRLPCYSHGMPNNRDHADDEPVTVGYSASSNISFNGSGEELGYTWGEWRQMTDREQSDALTEHLWTLVDLYVEVE